MVFEPETYADVERLVRDQIPESLHLEYKRSDALRHDKTSELTKDVSGLANSDGGTIVYGVIEDKHRPMSIDGGVDNTITREWIDQILLSHINPHVDCRIRQLAIPQSPGRSLYVLIVGRSNRGPHQSQDHKYYKRSNFVVQPMEHYEVEDVWNRRFATQPSIAMRLDASQNHMIDLIIENTGRLPLNDVRFSLPEGLAQWAKDRQAHALLNGIRTFQPRQVVRFLYGFYPDLVREGGPGPREFGISVSYASGPNADRVTERFDFDLMQWFGSRPLTTPDNEERKQTRKALEEIASEVKGIGQALTTLSTLRHPTGLALSKTALGDLRRVLTNQQPAKIDPTDYDYDALIEILGIDGPLAFRIWNFCRGLSDCNNIADVEGVTPELLAKIRQTLILPKPVE